MVPALLGDSVSGASSVFNNARLMFTNESLVPLSLFFAADTTSLTLHRHNTVASLPSFRSYLSAHTSPRPLPSDGSADRGARHQRLHRGGLLPQAP